MRRNLDLVRHIMLTTLDAEDKVWLQDIANDDFEDIKVINYHVKLLRDAGYIDAYYQKYLSGEAGFYIDGLTWKGQDLAESMVSDKVWKKAHVKILSVLGTTTFEVIKDVCVSISKELMGI